MNEKNKLERMKNYINSASMIFFDALAFLCHKKEEEKKLGQFLYSAIFGGLVAEWLLKFIYLFEDRDVPKTHNLYKLYKNLDEEWQNKVFETYKYVSQCFYFSFSMRNNLKEMNKFLNQEGLNLEEIETIFMEKKEDFEKLLKDSSKIFEEVRYLYEYDSYSKRVSVTFLTLLITSLLKVLDFEVRLPFIGCFLEFVPKDGSYLQVFLGTY